MIKSKLTRRKFCQVTGGAMLGGLFMVPLGQHTALQLHWGLTSQLFHPDFNRYVYEQAKAYLLEQGWSLDIVNLVRSTISEHSIGQAEAFTTCHLHILAKTESHLFSKNLPEQEALIQIQQASKKNIPILQQHLQENGAINVTERWVIPYQKSGGLYYRRCTLNVAEVGLQTEHIGSQQHITYI